MQFKPEHRRLLLDNPSKTHEAKLKRKEAFQELRTLNAALPRLPSGEYAFEMAARHLGFSSYLNLVSTLRSSDEDELAYYISKIVSLRTAFLSRTPIPDPDGFAELGEAK